MADGMTLLRVVINKLLHCGQTHSEPTKELLGADTTGSAVARVGKLQLNWVR